MARPRIFVSSTYYDLKHVRSSLDSFIESMGFESVLSEKGNITFSPDIPLDESCYREASNVDIFILIIGGRYGSSASSDVRNLSSNFYEKYNSITKKEYDSARVRDIPIYILIEHNVYSEYQTYLKNIETSGIHYAHVESVNVFELIRDILSRRKNNPFHTFEKSSEIEMWLKEQWAGLFRELLQRMSNQKQIETLSSQVHRMGEINNTLRKYLEEVMIKVSPTNEAQTLIDRESERLGVIDQIEQLKNNAFFQKAYIFSEADPVLFREALLDSNTFKEFAEKFGALTRNDNIIRETLYFHNDTTAIKELNEARKTIGESPFPLPSI